MEKKNEIIQKEVISILVKNEAGVLSRIAGLFSRRGYNIDALSVCATEDERYSRMTVTVTETLSAVNQIIAQLEKQEDVVKVMVLNEKKSLFRELLLLKLEAGPEIRSEIVDLCALFGAKALDVFPESMVLELTGSTQKIDSFIDVVSKGYTILEIVRTGGAALERGSGIMAKD